MLPALVIATAAASLLTRPADPPAAVAGTVRDAAGLPAPGATVLLCDAASGLPLMRESRRPLSVRDFSAVGDDAQGQRPAFLTATTDAAGHFTFEPPVAPGAYRLVAQSWDRSPEFVARTRPRDGAPAAAPVSFDHMLTVNGDILNLLGIATVTVRESGAAIAALAPLGSESLLVDLSGANDETLLVLSLAPTAADPILAFAGWSGPFMRNMVGATRMPRGVTLVHGLPAGTVYAAVMAGDNIPGWGAAAIDVGPGSNLRTEIPFVVSWSDGVHSPPPALAPLAAELAAAGITTQANLAPLLARAGIDLAPDPNLRGMEAFLHSMSTLAAHLDTPVTLPGGREVRCADAAAAAAYNELQARLKAAGRPVNPYRAATVGPR